MANNSKIAGTTTSASEPGLGAKLSEALESVYAGRESTDILKALEQEAVAAGNLALARRVRTAQLAIARKGDRASMVEAAPSEMAIQVHLNRGEAQEAVTLAESTLKASPERAAVHYLKALALAQLGEADRSAEALGKSLALEPTLHHQYLLEKEFDAFRSNPAFGDFERL